MSCLSRHVVENRIRQQQAREQGNTNALFGLIALGCLLFAGHALFTQAGRLGHSLKDMLRKITTNPAKTAVKQFAKEEWRNVAEYTSDAHSDDRDR